MKPNWRFFRTVVAQLFVVFCFVALSVVSQLPPLTPHVATAAVTNSFSTFGQVSYSPGNCGVDDTNSVMVAPGVKSVFKISNTEIYVGGCFTNFAGVASADYVAKWDGSSWSGLGADGSINAIVHDMVFYQGKLVIAGEFTDVGGDVTADMVAKWDGSSWSGLAVQCSGSCFNSNGVANGYASPKAASGDRALSLHVHPVVNGVDLNTSNLTELYVGGQFMGIYSETGPLYFMGYTQNIARFRGTYWQSLTDSYPLGGSGMDTDMAVRDFAEIGDSLYIGTFRNAGIPTSFGTPTARRLKALMRLTNGTWSEVFTNIAASSGTGFGVMKLARSGGTLIVGGNFKSVNGQSDANYVVTVSFDGTVSGFSGIDPNAVFANGAAIRSMTTSSTGQLFVSGSMNNFGRVSGGVGHKNGTTFVGLGPTSPAVVNCIMFDENYSGTNDRLILGSPSNNIGGNSDADGLALVELSSESTIESVQIDVGSMNAPFDPATTSYQVSLPNAASSVTFTVAATKSASSLVRTNQWGPLAMYQATDTLYIDEGTSINVTFQVISSSGTSTTTYTFAVTRASAATSSSSSSSSTSTTTTTTEAPAVPPTTAPPSGSNSGAVSIVSNVVRHGATTSKTTLLKLAKTTVPAGGKYSLKIPSTYSKVCKVSGTGVKTLKAGSCKVTITITPKKGRVTSKIVTLKVT